MNKLKRLLPIAFLLVSVAATAQIGGDNVYEFLNLSTSARVSGLGGALHSVIDDDVNLANFNPAVANDSMHLRLTFNHNFHFGGIQNGYVAYAHHLKKWDVTLHGGVQYINYGDFNETDVFENVLGTFDAKETAVTLGAGKQLYERLRVGVNMRMISSQLENFSSFGMTADVGAVYMNEEKRFSLSLVAKNMGGQLTTYREGNREAVPYDLQIGLSKQLKHLPFRFSVIYHNLNRWNILYDDPNTEEDIFIFTEEQPTENPAADILDNLARHFIVNGEFLFGQRQNFRLRFGYNHLRKQELSVRNLRSLAGFSVGVGIKVYKFRLDYGRSVYHLAGGTNHISISTSITEFTKKGIVD